MVRSAGGDGETLMTSEPHGAQPGEPASIIDDLQDLLKAAWTVQEVAETRAKEAREELFRVARALCASTLDQQRQAAEWETKALADLIIFEVGRQRDELVWLRNAQQTGKTEAAQQIEELQQQLKDCRHDLQTSQTDLAQARAEKEQLKRGNAGYEQELASLRLDLQAAEKRALLAQPATSHMAPVTLPALSVESNTPADQTSLVEADWLKTWTAARTFARDSGFIQLLGESLECRRESLLKAFGSRYGQEQSEQTGGAFKEMVRRLEELGLIEQIKVSSVQRGEPPRLMWLLAKGCAAYRFLVEREPLLGYATLKARHTNEQQVYLALEAADLLALERYTVDLLPAATVLTDGSHFAPDVVATRGHERICVEVETDAEYKNSGDRQKKWRIMATGTGGQIYAVTRTAKTMHRLRGEIQDQRYGRTVMVRLTNLEEAREQHAQHNTIWVDERSIN